MSSWSESHIIGLIDMDMSGHGFFATRLLTLRKWERRHIPLFSPQIALDIMLYAAASEADGRQASAKEFHLALGHSKDRVREVLQSLLTKSWIRHAPDPHDARFKRISLTAMGRELIGTYQSEYVSRVASGRAA